MGEGGIGCTYITEKTSDIEEALQLDSRPGNVQSEANGKVGSDDDAPALSPVLASRSSGEPENMSSDRCWTIVQGGAYSEG